MIGAYSLYTVELPSATVTAGGYIALKPSH